MKKLHYYLLFIFMFSQSVLVAQSFDWLKTGFRPDCSNGVYPRDVTSSANGNITSTGYFYAPSTTVDFDGLTMTQNGTGFSSDVFVANYNSTGTIQWLKKIGTDGTDGTYPRIDTDANDNIFVGAELKGTTGGTNGDVAGTSLPNVYPNDAVLTKLSSTGNTVWVQHMTDATGDIFIRDVEVDANGDVYVTGSFEGSITVDGTTQTADGLNFYLAKFDTNGNLIWWRNSTGVNSDRGYRVHAKGNNVYVLGEMAQGNVNTTMTVGTTTHTLTAGEDRAHFLLKYDSAGNLTWFKYGYLENTGFGSGIFPYYCDIAVDDNDDIYTIHSVTPESQASATYRYPGTTVTYNTVANTSGSGQSNYIISKYNSNGDAQWARGDGTSTEGTISPTQMILHSDGNLIVTAIFSETTEIDNVSFTSAGSEDAIIAQFDLEADLVCHEQYGGTNQDWVMALDENPDGTCAYAGHVFGGSTEATITSYDGINLTGCRNTGVTGSFTTKAVNADFSFVTYPSGEVCQPNSNGLTLSASPSGYTKTFTSTPTGLSLNSSSGEIDVNASTPGVYTVSHILTDGSACGSDTVSKSFTINEAPTSNAGTDFSLCGTNGSLDASIPNSGNGTWSQVSGPTGASITNTNTPNSDITGLSEGTFTYEWEVINSCGTVTDQVVVTVSEIPVVNAGTDQDVCEGNQITLTATTSTGTVSWDNGVTDNTPFNPTATQTYTVTADNNGCQDTDDVLITVIDSPVVNAGADQEVCEGEQVTLTATTSIGTVSWDNGVTDNTPFNPTASQTYTVTADNNGCQDTDDVLVTVIDSPVVNAGADQEICEGEQVTLVATTSTGTVTWDNGVTDNTPFNPTATQTYTVTADNNGCQDSDEVIVTVNELPVVDAGADETTCDYYDPITLNGSPTGGTFSGTGVTGNEFDPSVGVGTYTLTYTYTDGNGCEASDDLSITVDGCASINENDISSGIVVMPNPATDYLDVVTEGKQEIKSIQLVSAEGRVVKTSSNTIDQNTTRLDVSQAETGTYFIQLSTSKGVITKKVIIH